MLQFRFFLRNDVSLLLLLFWLFTLALSSFSYCLSVFINRAQTATYTGFAVFLVRQGSVCMFKGGSCQDHTVCVCVFWLQGVWWLVVLGGQLGVC